MQAGIGGPLTQLHHGNALWLIAAIVFTSRAPAPPDRDAQWMRWGTQLALHSDMDDELWSLWMTREPDDDRVLTVRGEKTQEAPAWISLDALLDTTQNCLLAEYRRRDEALRRAHYVREERGMAKAANKLRGKGHLIMRKANEAYAYAQNEHWKGLTGDGIHRCAVCVLTEFREDKRCGYCGGNGVMPHIVDERRKEIRCAACYGTGLTHRSDRARADALDVTRTRWASTWRAPYEWLYQQALTARREAVRHLREQLSG